MKIWKNVKRKQFLKNKQAKIMRRLQRNNRHKKKVRHIFHKREFKSGERILRFLSTTEFIGGRLKRYYNGLKSKFMIDGNKKIELTIPEVFSFTDNPEETIEVLQKLTKVGLNTRVKKIFIDHSSCRKLDIGASTVMDALILSIKDKCRNKPFELRGHIGNRKEINEILMVSGILKHLHISEISIPGIECLNLLHNETSAEMAQKIIEYLIRCLNSQGFGIKRKGVRDLGEMLSEILDNCKQHSVLHEWFALGHYSKEEERRGKVRLVIFNFGKTIYESFSEKESDPSMYGYLKEEANKIRTQYPNSPSIESLITLYALQDGVSRFKNRGKESDRGSGTIKLISIFQAIGRDKEKKLPSMSITSGRSQIIFDNKYQIKPSIINGVKKQIIAFNSENDMRLPPDSNNVKDLSAFFPGTVISMEFYIDKDYLEEAMKGENTND